MSMTSSTATVGDSTSRYVIILMSGAKRGRTMSRPAAVGGASWPWLSLLLANLYYCSGLSNVAAAWGIGRPNCWAGPSRIPLLASVRRKTPTTRMTIQQERRRFLTGLAAASSSSGLPADSSSSSFSSASSTHRRPSPLILLNGLQDLVDAYDVFFIDMWGVLHDGIQPYPGVLPAFHALLPPTTTTTRPRPAGSSSSSLLSHKQIVILSNSSKRIDHAGHLLQKMGFFPKEGGGGSSSSSSSSTTSVTESVHIITSGELSHELLTQLAQRPDRSASSMGASSPHENPEPEDPWRTAVWERRRQTHTDTTAPSVIILGSGDQDEEYCTSSGWTLAASMEQASLIVARGTFCFQDAHRVIYKDDRGNDEDDGYHQVVSEQLQLAAQLKIPMLVCNPDKVRPDADRSPMPGALGDLYEQTYLGGGPQAEILVKRIGKPLADVYEKAWQLCQSAAGTTVLDPARVCMIGDALETDVTGGSAAGVATVWVLQDGIHGPDVGQLQADHPSWTLSEAAQAVVDEFNHQTGTYAKGRPIQPDYIIPHFQW